MTFELTKQEQAEVERATWYVSRGQQPPYTSTAVLLDALARAVAEEPAELDGGEP